jgi:hypothetical protein
MGEQTLKLLGKTTLIILMIIVLSASVWGTPSDFFNRARGLGQWGLSLGFGNNYRIPEDSDVPHMEFSVLTVDYENFLSTRSSVDYELSFAAQTNVGFNEFISVSANYKRYFFVRDRLSANYKIGFGVMYLQERLSGQATTTNFNEQAGLGLEYATGSNGAITLEATFYHASNANLQHPNHGINVTFVKLGYCWH